MKSFTFRLRNKEIRLKSSSCNVRNLARFFRVSENLFVTCGDQAEFPLNGDFQLEDFPDRAIFNIVLESDEQSSSQAHVPSLILPSQTPDSSSQASFSNRIISHSATRAAVSRRVLAVVKIVRADVGSNGKPTNVHLHNLSVHVNIYKEDQASVPYLLNKVRNEMDNDELILVGPNGLIYYDQEGTRGTAFWKIGSRKIYAVSENELKQADDGQDDDFATPLPKRKRKSDASSTVRHVSETLDNLVHEISDMAGKVEGFNKLAFRHKFSLSFLQALEGSFKCCICRKSPPKTPLTACQACSSLVGCQQCTDRLYGGINGLDQPCPKCRTPRGLSKSFVLKGFDDLIQQIKQLNNENNSSSEDESDGQLNDTLPIVHNVNDD